ncbi:17114_t:CDS:2 [Dentiscutata erythropus]|uniref:17114_t:CDS:1 n=1 Tax=Dentiscutata erythropus TaxID=1348616 RepID=A0A9N9HAW1_9GLOM|nr:17114_t:CDS:2 [Dentiscutata erythropus]
MEHLKATLIEIGEYSELAAEQFVNNIQQIIIQYGANYINTNIQSSSVEVVGVDHFLKDPSSVTSERAFSRAGFMVTHDKANLSEKTISSTILMHSWLLESQNEVSLLHILPETK